MEKGKIFGIISVGILFGALFPFGLHSLLFKIFERLLFLTDLNVFMSSGIAAYSSVIFTIFLFIWTMKKLTNSDFNQIYNIRKKIGFGILANLVLYFIWALIPIIDNQLGGDYKNTIFENYRILSSEFIKYEVLINQLSPILCFVIIIGIIYKKTNTIANTVYISLLLFLLT